MNFDLYQEGCKYALQNIYKLRSFHDFSIALVDRFGEGIIPFCLPLYTGIQELSPKDFFQDNYMTYAKCTSSDILRWYEEFRYRTEKYKKRKEIEKGIGELYLLVKEYRSSDIFQKMIRFVAQFPHIAPYNAMLIYHQKAGAKLILTIRKWRQYNRQPKPNAQHLVTLVPFGPVQFMYDYDDTEPINPNIRTTYEDLLDEFNKTNVTLVKKQGISHTLYLLKYNLAYYGIYLDEGHSMANTYWGNIQEYDKKLLKLLLKRGPEERYADIPCRFMVTVNGNHSPEEQLCTIFHELGHLFCQHIFYNHDKIRKLTIKQEEFEAETVSWLVCKRCGIINPSEHYLVSYAPKGEIPTCDIDYIMKAVAEIEKMLSEPIISLKSTYWYKHDEALKKYYNENPKTQTHIIV